MTKIPKCAFTNGVFSGRSGSQIYASGSNAEAARLSGVRVQLIKLTTFVISGGAAALGGVIDASRVLSAQASNGETTLTFTVLAGIVVGGTSILGGEGPCGGPWSASCSSP
jgi:ribose transport system permease protein